MSDPEGCPFHYLPPEQTVWIELDGGMKRPYSAELACDDYHFGLALQPAINAALEALDRIILAETAELSVCYRKPAEG